MNPTDPKHPWSRLTAAARRVPAAEDAAAPYGFFTRMAALAFAPERAPVSLFERFSLRALAVACLLALVSMAANYNAVAGEIAEEASMLSTDPVAELVELIL